MGKSKTIQVYGFPKYVTVESVKQFLELYVGSGNIYAMKLKEGKRAYAIVQFTSSDLANTMISLANRISYGNSYLNAKELDNDIVPRPRVFLHSMEGVTLSFGCQISSEKFCVLWSEENVSVNFGLGLKRINFLLSHGHVKYKFELFYENIWKLHLHRSREQAGNILLVQLLGAPRIYEKGSEQNFEFLGRTFFKDDADDQWVRTTDFTPYGSIGQSSAFCLEFPRNQRLPNFRENFAFFSEDDGRFTLETGSSYSRNLQLVPIVGPPLGMNIPYNLLFRICLLVQHGCLSGPTLDANFYRLINPRKIDISCIEHALEKLYQLKECCYEPVKWLAGEYRKYLASVRRPKPPLISLDAGLVYVRRAQITPSKIYFWGPEVNISNRVLRNYANDIENFLRVSFVDEELDKMYSTDLISKISSGSENKQTAIYGRVLSTLQDGISIGDKKFEFLAFSSSQLRENSAWFFASRPGLTVANIREWMGDFREIRNVAKYAARLGQSFGSSKETLSVKKNETRTIPDVEVRSRHVTYNFSDGIGKISADFADRVAIKCGLGAFTPSAFQIRYAGYKGVVAVDPTSPVKLSLRNSMLKYKSENTKLDVLAWSKYQPCFLNRQLITLLSTLGVRDYVFEMKQREAIKQLDSILTDPLSAEEALELMAPGENTNVLKEMLSCGYKPDTEPFLAMMLKTFRASKLQDLRIKTRIFVPDGRSMMGCLDETRSLEYGQVFVQFSSNSSRLPYVDSRFMYSSAGSSRSTYIVKGKVVVAKNPCLHPGDVRVLEAIDVPRLHHMVDCVVFPQKGTRPHPNECSGSDLDGDIYFVCWDEELIPPRQNNPMDYTPEPTVCLDHDVTMEEVYEYFANYIVNDSLGIISNAHTVFADKSPAKAMSEQCIELAKLFSVAVDFPKTGVPAVIPNHLYVKEYPDFMEKPDKPTYESQNVIGKLFREVRAVAPDASHERHFTREIASRSYDPDMEYDGYEDYISDASYHKSNYDYKLGNLMDYYGVKTEAEILSGGIIKMSRSFDRRRDGEAITMAIRALRKEARAWFNEWEDGVDPGLEENFAKASAWYHVTYHPDYYGFYNEGLKRDHFLSFPWCVYDKLVSIKKEKVSRRRYQISLNDHFRRSLRLG